MPRGGVRPMSDFIGDLGLPRGFSARSGGEDGVAYQAAIEWLANQRPRRQNYWPALTLGFIAQAEQVLDALSTERLQDGLEDERLAIEQADTSARSPVYTLNLRAEDGDGSIVRLRPLYNAALGVIRTEMRRAHPSNPGHATQSWPHYRALIHLILSMSPSERTALAAWVWQHGVLEREEVTRTQHRSRQVRRFYEVVASFDTAHNQGGVFFQAMVYAYLAADSPTLRVESNAVNTGASRAGAVGDVDGYDGEFVVVAAEAKDRHLAAAQEDVLTGFIDDVSALPDADAVVFAHSFDQDMIGLLESQGLRTVSRAQMMATVALWDPMKQEVALKAMRYFLVRIQKNPELLAPLDAFLGALETTTTP